MAGSNCSACGAKIPPYKDPNSWDVWCDPCQTRIKLEQPWYVPGMGWQDRAKAQAQWELEHGKKPVVELLDCPFCGAEQAFSGPYFCVAVGPAPYIVRMHEMSQQNRRTPVLRGGREVVEY